MRDVPAFHCTPGEYLGKHTLELKMFRIKLYKNETFYVR
jgi:hypothetical protein